MPQTVEITEGPLARERQAALADVLVRTLGVEREEAELTALMVPCSVGPLASADDRERLLVALAGAGFAARPGAAVAEDGAFAAAIPAPPVYTAPVYAAPAPPEAYAPESARASNGPIVAAAVVLAVVALGLGAFVLSGRAAPPAETVAVDAPPPGSDAGVQTVIDEPADDLSMDGDAMAPEGDMMAPEPAAPQVDALPSPPAPSGDVHTVRLSDGQLSMTLSENGQTWRLPRALSPSTSISGIQRRTLAGRDVVQFEARDGRWATTYYWEVRQGLLHFVGQDGSGTTNVSEAPGSRAVVQAALGYVPGDDVVRGDAASRAPARSAPRRTRGPDTASAPNIIVLGSYQPYDQAGLDARYAQAQQTGLTLQVVPSETYGMTPGLTVIVAGPYDRETALRLLGQARLYVPDAFRNSLD